MTPTIAAQLTHEIRIINSTLQAFGVQAGTRPGWTLVAGSSFVAFGLRTGARQRIADIERLLPELSERLSAARRRRTPVRLRDMPLALETEHPAPAPLDWRGVDLAVGDGRMIAGRNYAADGAHDCVLDLAARPHVLLAGTTGSGKSTVLRMLLSSLAYNTPPEALRLVLVDRKNEDLVPFAALPHVEAVAWTGEATARAIGQVHAELHRRIAQGTGDWPRLVLAIDELAQVEQLDLLSSILAVGRSKRVHVVAATQHPTVKLIGDRANYSVRLVGRVTDAATAAIATGRRGSGAELLSSAGAFLLVDGPRVERLQAYNLDADGGCNLVQAACVRWGMSPRRLDVSQETPALAVDDVGRLARQLAPLVAAGASKNAMCKATLGRPYAGGYAAKIDRALERLAAEGSTTTAEPSAFLSGTDAEQV